LNLVQRIAGAARLLATGKLALSTGFEGAQMQRRLVAWRAGGESINSLILQGGELQRARARQLVRTNPSAANASASFTAHAVGCGIKPSSLVEDGALSCGPRRSRPPRRSGSEARGRWDLASGLKKQAQIDELIAFFRARRGRAYGFRFKDWTDYKATGQLLGTGDDAQTQFQLVKHYPSGSVIEVRTITKPVAGTVKVYLDAMEQLSGWSVDTTTGLVTFGTAPALGVQVTADLEFDVPVRFDTDHMAVTIESYRLHAWQQIPIVELRT
jgi:uncharacterized protein (TIGR02217 family)